MEQDQNNNNSFFRFEDLRVYHKALDYIDWVINSCALFPETGGDIARRFSRAANNIALYIAEGSSRNKSQFVYYLKLAKSAVRECVVITSIAEKQGLLTETLVDESRNELMELTKMLGALIGSLQRSNNGKNRTGRQKNNYDQEDEIDEFETQLLPDETIGMR
ncbi:MAG: hypothetical protein Kow00127_23670 [Bacteroidales bacterium]